jgi:hypothetical protein
LGIAEIEAPGIGGYFELESRRLHVAGKLACFDPSSNRAFGQRGPAA